MFGRFSLGARSAIERAWALACGEGSGRVEPRHLLAALAESTDSSFCGLLERFAVAPAEIRDAVAGRETQRRVASSEEGGTTVFSRGIRRVFEYAVEEADRLGDREIGTRHFLLALLREGEREGGVAQVLLQEGLDLDEVRRGLLQCLESGADGDGTLARAFMVIMDLRRRVEALERRFEAIESRWQRLETVMGGRGRTDGERKGEERWHGPA